MAVKPSLRVITKAEYLGNRERIIQQIREGAVFIYPTQAMYCLGCDATNPKAIRRLRKIKGRFPKPMRVIPPSKAWVRKWCHVGKNADEWLDRIPGTTVLLLRHKPRIPVAPEVNPFKDQAIAVKIPKHWSSEIPNLLGRPIVTTTANLMGKNLMTSLGTLPAPLRRGVDFVLYEGPKNGAPIALIDLKGR